MKRSVSTLLAALALSAALPALAGEPAGPGRGMRGPRARMYDPKTVATFSGRVVAVHRMDGRRHQGVHLELQTANETLAVHVGPSWFLEKEKLQLAAGDEVEVTGSRVTMGGEPAVIAQSVKKGETAVALRDVNGVPVWAGHGGPHGP